MVQHLFPKPQQANMLVLPILFVTFRKQKMSDNVFQMLSLSLWFLTKCTQDMELLTKHAMHMVNLHNNFLLKRYLFVVLWWRNNYHSVSQTWLPRRKPRCASSSATNLAKPNKPGSREESYPKVCQASQNWIITLQKKTPSVGLHLSQAKQPIVCHQLRPR